jgi:hypothetical protein
MSPIIWVVLGLAVLLVGFVVEQTWIDRHGRK